MCRYVTCGFGFTGAGQARGLHGHCRRHISAIPLLRRTGTSENVSLLTHGMACQGDGWQGPVSIGLPAPIVCNCQRDGLSFCSAERFALMPWQASFWACTTCCKAYQASACLIFERAVTACFGQALESLMRQQLECTRSVSVYFEACRQSLATTY